MTLLLGQLIYTSFSEVGFQVLTSVAIPSEIRQTFINQIVYQYWDSYNPPGADYRAVYLYRVMADQTLFGWLYNDGADDLSRSHVPYFVCYYLAGLLRSAHLEAIFTCLSTGPATLVDRRSLPDQIESVVLPDFEDYQSARPGIAITLQIREHTHLALEQGDLFKLFIPGEAKVERLSRFAESANSFTLEELTSQENFSNTTGGRRSKIDSVTAERSNSLVLNQSLKLSKTKAYQQIPLTEIQDAPPQRQPELFSKARIGIAVGAVSLMALTFGGLQLLQRVLVATAQRPTISNQTSATRLNNLTLAKTFTEHSGSVWSIALSPDGQTLYSGSADRTIKILNIETGEVLATLSGHQGVVRSLALTPDRKTLISGSSDRTIRIWDLQTNQPIQTLPQASSIWAIAVSQDGRSLISGSEDGVLTIWDLPNRKPLYTIPAHQEQIFSAVISPDGKTVATASLDRTLKIWNLQTGELMRIIAGHTDSVRALAFSPNGKTLASASWDRTLKLWNWQTGELIHTCVGHTARAVAVAFSPDGKTIVSGSVDRTIKLWSAQDATLLRTLSEPTGWVLAIAVDSHHIISGSKDPTIRVWQLR